MIVRIVGRVEKVKIALDASVQVRRLNTVNYRCRSWASWLRTVLGDSVSIVKIVHYRFSDVEYGDANVNRSWEDYWFSSQEETYKICGIRDHTFESRGGNEFLKPRLCRFQLKIPTVYHRLRCSQFEKTFSKPFAVSCFLRVLKSTNIFNRTFCLTYNTLWIASSSRPRLG